MRVLATNDDGIGAPGLIAMAEKLVRAGHDVIVAAPSRERSGSGTSLGTIADGAEVKYSEVTIPTLPGTRALAIDAPPAFVVRAVCLGAFGAVPDLVTSGINPGHNTGAMFIHSGTVGAAMTAITCGVSAVAVSTAPQPSSRFDVAAELCSGVVFAMGELDLDIPAVLSLNVPGLELSEIEGVRIEPIGATSLTDISVTRGDAVLTVHRKRHTEIPDIAGDSAAVRDGFATLTPLAFGMPTDAPTVWQRIAQRIHLGPPRSPQ